jgi:hypothetical protein
VDQKARDVICGLVSIGFSKYQAARHAGIARRTMYRTLKEDQEFARLVQNAEMHQQLSPLQYIKQHMAKDWRAASWMMERTRPQEWARRPPNTVTLGDMHGIFGAIIKALLEGLPGVEDRNRMLQRFDEFFRNIVESPQRCSPRVRKAIQELESGQELLEPTPVVAPADTPSDPPADTPTDTPTDSTADAAAAEQAPARDNE